MPKKGYNIYKRKDGRWEGRIACGYHEDGRKKYRSIYGRTYKEVRERLMKEALRPVCGRKPGRITIGEVVRIWLEEGRSGWKESTYACYRQIVERQILPAIGNVPAAYFRAGQFTEFALLKHKEGNLLNGKALSETYLKGICRIIIQAVKYVRRTRSYDLPVPELPSVRKSRQDMKLPAEHSLRKLDSYLRGSLPDSVALGILLCMYTGIRIGEACALQWKDIDRRTGTMRIYKTVQRIKNYEGNLTEAAEEIAMNHADRRENKTKLILCEPKTEYACRSIPVPQHMLGLLEQYRGAEEAYIMPGKHAPYMEPRLLQYRFQAVLKECGLPSFKFHLLRHFFATRCISLGFDTKTLSEILGHSNIKITLGMYVHSSGDRKKMLMDQFAPFVA